MITITMTEQMVFVNNAHINVLFAKDKTLPVSLAMLAVIKHTMLAYFLAHVIHITMMMESALYVLFVILVVKIV
jgi:hypothetical protein